MSRDLCSRFGYLFASALMTFAVLNGCKMETNTNPLLPRNQTLRLFEPHMRSFDCVVEESALPQIDAQADQWFREARALEDPEIYVSDRDYPRIVQLTRQAAERHHWKAMLNLASFYVEGRDARYGTEDAVRLIESAMLLHVPAAYDRMGTYYMNGVGVPVDATKAYAFWQKAAEMGNPQAMAYLGARLRAIEDNIIPGFWGNIPVAKKMLECALSQGYGPAAYKLYGIYLRPLSDDGTTVKPATSDTRAAAFRVLHEGVRHGCSDCAIMLYLEFDPTRMDTTVVPFVDKARTERYRILARALEFNPDLRLPNLDQVLPLPPATIPTWNGDEDTLLEAAMGVSHPPKSEKPVATPPTKDRHAINGPFKLERGNEKTSDFRAPFAGYWQPTAPDHPDLVQWKVAQVKPGLYAKGESFDAQYFADSGRATPVTPLIWLHWLTVDQDEHEIRPKAVTGLTRVVQFDESLKQCASHKFCAATGIWQPWIDPNHAMSRIVNQHWRQSWVLKGQPFPDPQRDWLLALPSDLITWHLMDRHGVDIDRDLNV